MEPNQSGKSLSDLPETKNEFWKDAECELRPTGEVRTHTHYFEKVEGAKEAKCKCGFGLFLSAEDSVRDGHLYQNDKLVY